MIAIEKQKSKKRGMSGRGGKKEITDFSINQA
jgi:hypothetical protein